MWCWPVSAYGIEDGVEVAVAWTVLSVTLTAWGIDVPELMIDRVRSARYP